MTNANPASTTSSTTNPALLPPIERLTVKVWLIEEMAKIPTAAGAPRVSMTDAELEDTFGTTLDAMFPSGAAPDEKRFARFWKKMSEAWEKLGHEPFPPMTVTDMQAWWAANLPPPAPMPEPPKPISSVPPPLPDMFNCTSCGHTNPLGQKFCSACGFANPHVAPPPDPPPPPDAPAPDASAAPTGVMSPFIAAPAPDPRASPAPTFPAPMPIPGDGVISPPPAGFSPTGSPVPPGSGSPPAAGYKRSPAPGAGGPSGPPIPDPLLTGSYAGGLPGYKKRKIPTFAWWIFGGVFLCALAIGIIALALRVGKGKDKQNVKTVPTVTASATSNPAPTTSASAAPQVAPTVQPTAVATQEPPPPLTASATATAEPPPVQPTATAAPTQVPAPPVTTTPAIIAATCDWQIEGFGLSNCQWVKGKEPGPVQCDIAAEGGIALAKCGDNAYKGEALPSMPMRGVTVELKRQ